MSLIYHLVNRANGEGVCLAILHPKSDNKYLFFKKKLIGATTCNLVGMLYW